MLCWAPWISRASPHGQRKLSVIPRCLQSEVPLYNCCSLITFSLSNQSKRDDQVLKRRNITVEESSPLKEINSQQQVLV